jgi:D-sedoheptulose 7-phosphate isomerase
MNAVISNALLDARSAIDALIVNAAALAAIDGAARRITGVFDGGGRLFACGNGGSMCDAMHLAEELSGRYRLERRALPAIAISDPGHLSCVANDYGYDQVFSRYIEAHGRPGDCLVGISTSGTSRNVLAAAEAARRRQLSVIALTGRAGSALSALADIDICTPAGQFADRVQELHIKVVHILIELVERTLFPENYRTAPH